MKTLTTLSLAALLLSSTAVMAQSQQAFDRLDSDGNDKLSYTDLLIDWPDLTQAQFDAADIDGDDFLDLTQFDALSASIGASANVEVAAAGTVSPDVGGPLFESIDSNGDEKIAFDDLTSFGIDQATFDAADLDNDDFLDRSQYEAIKGKLVVPAGMEAEANVAVGLSSSGTSERPLFENLDADGDGKVDFSDLRTVWPDLTQEQFDAADLDNDDFLDKTQYESIAM